MREGHHKSGRRPSQIIATRCDTGEETKFISYQEAGEFFGVVPNHISNLCRSTYRFCRDVYDRQGNKYSLRRGERHNPDGSKIIDGLDERESRAFIEAHNQISERTCLVCERKFKSNGPWNRRCNNCHSKFEMLDYTNPLKYGIGSIGSARKRVNL